MEVFLVGSQAQFEELNLSLRDSDVDLLILVNDDKNTDLLFSELSRLGLTNSILFHPLIMTKHEFHAKLQIAQYGMMLRSAKRIYPAQRDSK
jgi:predicted nucleotidyltransferase